MYPRVLPPPTTSFFLLGLRGSGKSSWVRSHYEGAKRFDLLRESEFQRFLVNTDLFREELRACPRGSWVIVDEVQRLPQLLNEVHSAMEEHGLRFALLGSSARKLRQAGVNLLGGRALQRTMYPLLPRELGGDFDLDRVLQCGSLPLIVTSPSPVEQLEAYVHLYLKEEIQQEALVRNLPGFSRFLPIAALFHGQTLNVASLSRDAGVARTTVEGYLTILEDTLLCYRLRAFEPRLRVKERSHPKWYWIDSGVMRAAKKSLGVPSVEERGALFEGFIGMLLRSYNDLRICRYDSLSYWSPPGGDTEVDFILERGDERIAIEVKSTTVPHRSHLKGLERIKDLPNLSRRILVHCGDGIRRSAEGIDILGFREFVEELDKGLSG